MVLVKLVSLCASHINNERRLQYFVYMIQSWREQKYHVPLHVSISYAPQFEQLIDRIASQNSKQGLSIYRTHQHLTQFEHYDRLAKLMDVAPETWCLFTDDDDLWNPMRSHFYHHAITKALSTDIKSQISDVRSPSTFSEETEQVMLSVKKFAELPTELPTNFVYKSHNINYVSFSCRFRHFKQFLEKCPSIFKTHKFCDVLFSRFIQNSDAKHVRCDPFVPPLYFWRVSDVYKAVQRNKPLTGNVASDFDLINDATCDNGLQILFIEPKISLLEFKRKFHEISRTRDQPYQDIFDKCIDKHWQMNTLWNLARNRNITLNLEME
jgi:hypothetical protein